MTEPTCRILKNDAEDIAAAAALIRNGELVAFPTETVYGLGGDATDDRAVAVIFAAKDRPKFNPLIVHCAEIEEVSRIVAVDARARRVADAFWPGPLTLVLARTADSPVSLLAGAGLDTLAVRVPDHDLARALIRAAATPIAAPSANRSGNISPTRAEHAVAELGTRIAAVIDGGACRVGVESTVLDLSTPGPVILRPGKITAEDLAPVLGAVADAPGSGKRPKSPGRLERHYAPKTPLRLNAVRARPGEALLGFGPAGEAAACNLSAAGDLDEAAANLFAMLHALDAEDHTGIAVMPIPDRGLGRAINDRLRRAARD